MKIKNIINSVMAIAALLFSFNLSATEPTAKTGKDMKSIIVYFTHSGNTELAFRTAIKKQTFAFLCRLKFVGQ